MTTDMRLTLLATVAILMMLLRSCAAEAQDFSSMFADLECPAVEPCPPPPLATVCGLERGYHINVLPTSLDPIRVWPKGCGEYLEAQEIKPCLFVSISHYDSEGIRSSMVEGSSDPECQPVPEPSFSLTLAIGTGTILLLSRRRILAWNLCCIRGCL